MMNWALPKNLDIYCENLFETIKENYRLKINMKKIEFFNSSKIYFRKKKKGNGKKNYGNGET
jgi:hypothetical protein